MLVMPTYILSQSRSVRHFDTEDGLVGNITYTVLQDKDGYIWIPTNNGLCRYDGIEFKLYDSPLIANNEILGCGEAMGMIWFYTFGGNLFYIENDEIKRFEQAGGVVIQWIDVDDNTIFILIKDKKNPRPIIQRIKREGENWNIKSFHVRVSNNYAVKVFGKIKNQLYISAYNKIMGYDNVKDTLYLVLDHPTEARIGFNSKLGDKLTYYDDHPPYTKLYVFDGTISNPITPLKGFYHGRIFEDSQNRYWFTGNQPLLADSLTDTSPTELSTLLDGNVCNEITEDNEGNIWFSTNSNGIYVLYNTPFLNYTSQNSDLPNSYIYDIDGDDNGNVFIATHGGMLTAMKGKSIVDNEQITNSNREIYDVSVTQDDKILVAQNHPYLFYFDTIKNDLKKKGIIDNSNVKRFIETSDNSIITGSSVLTIINSPNIGYQYNVGNQGIKIYSGVKLYDKGILLGTNFGIYYGRHDISAADKIGGIRKIDNNVFADTPFKIVSIDDKIATQLINKFPFANGQFIDDYIADMKYGQDSSIWIASRKNGIYHIIDNTIHHHYTASEIGLTSNLCNRIYVDSNNRIWAATMNGISLISPKEKKVRKITTDDGLISNHVTSVYVRDSLIYVGTSKGLSLFHEADIKATGPHPPILINDIKINEADIPLAVDYQLAHSENTLLINYIGLSYKGKVRYKYRLKGLDNDWVFTSNNEVRFPELPPGKYDFEVKSITKDGIESADIASVYFRIKPHPLYSTTAFILYTLIIFGSILAYYQWRIWSIKRKEYEKTAFNKKIAELELQALQAQMNPHFIFNALGAVQNFILQEDEHTANRYLSDFGQLMRLFLESSKEKYITLNDELQLLQLYVGLERLRFDNKFEYHINMPNTINPYNIEIPSLLLQPFLENCINHGIRYLEGKGNLWLGFHLIDDTHLKCIVEDDGVGRKKSKEIRERSLKGYKSRGMQIVEERLETLSFINGSKIDVKAIDKEKDGVSTGTRIEIIIPIEL